MSKVLESLTEWLERNVGGGIMPKAKRGIDDSHSDVGDLAHQRGIPGVKHDFCRYVLVDGLPLWRMVSDKLMGQQVTEGHLDSLEYMEETLRKGGHPDSQVMLVWFTHTTTPFQPTRFWVPGMGTRERKWIDADKLEDWLNGGKRR